MGSIPPAASIEHPQREIVNFIADSALTPSAADVRQLSKGIQSGKVTYAQDAGTPNFIAITPTPPITAYQVGMRFCIKAAAQNTGPVQLNVSGVGWTPVVHGDLTPMGAWEIGVGQIIEVAWDGAGHWQMLTGSQGGLPLLTAPRTVYVNGATGSDTLCDGSQATVDVTGAHGPFQTIQKALSVMTTFNLGGWSFNIHVADGTYSITNTMQMPLPNGSGTVVLIGNLASPQAVLVHNTTTGGCFNFGAGGNWRVDGFSFRTTLASGSDPANSIGASGGSFVALNDVAFGPCAGSHISTANGASLLVSSKVIIWGGAAGSHIVAIANGIYNNWLPSLPVLTITTPVSIPAGFVTAAGGGFAYCLYTSITGAGNVTGQKYSVYGNGVLNLTGAGASYLPGSTAGVLATGGQII